MPPLNINKMAKELDDKGSTDETKSSESLHLPKAQQSSPAESVNAQSADGGGTSSPETETPSSAAAATAIPTVSGAATTLEDLPEEPEDQSESSENASLRQLNRMLKAEIEEDRREEEEASDEEGGGKSEELLGLVPKKPTLTTLLPKRPRSQTAPVPGTHSAHPYSYHEDNQDDSGEEEDEDDDEYNDKWDPDDLDIGPDDIPEPPDGGWGWVIVAASFLCNVVVDGIAYSFGILFMEFVNFYGAPKGKTAWVGSLLSGCYLSAGPLVSALTNRFGCRPVTIAGSIIACVAFLLSTRAPTVDILMITYGIMGGIGFGLIYLPAIVSVGYYFSTKRAFATGIAVCGSGVGAFVLAPACEKFLDIYDWKGTVMILAGLALNCVVFGALMRPLEANAKSSQATDRYNKPLLQRIAEEKERQRHASLCNSQFFLVQHADGTVEKRAKILLNTEPGVHSTLNLDQFGKSPTETPVVTLSPIEEVRKSPAGSRDEESSSEEKLTQRATPSESTPTLSTVPPTPLPSIVLPPTTPVQTPSVDGGSNQFGSTGIREIARRKGLINNHGGGRMKMSVSNITVNSELHHRKTSVPNSVHLSSSGSYLFPGQNRQNRNNNYLVEEVWKKLQSEESQVPLDGSRPSIKKPTKKDFARPMYRKDIFYSGSIRNLPEYNSSKDVRSYVTSVISIPRDVHASVAAVQEAGDGTDRPMSAAPPPRDTGCCAPCIGLMPKSMADTMKETLNFSLLKDPVFLLICIANIFGMLGFYIPYVYITDSSVMKGVPSDQAAFLLSIIGITNTAGRLFFGWLSDRPSVDALLVNNVSLTFCGFCILAIPFCQTYTTLVIDCTLFGLFVSAYICLTSIILVDLLGLDRLTNAFGILSLFRGSASILGPPIAGSIYDMTGSYDLPFFISGSLLVFSASLSFMVPCVRRYTERKRARSMENVGSGEDGEVEILGADDPNNHHRRSNGNCERNGGNPKRKQSLESKAPTANQLVSVV